MMRVFKFRSALWLSCVVLGYGLAAEERAPQPDEARAAERATRPIQSRQQKVGLQLDKTAVQFGEVLEEVHENFGVVLEAQGKLEGAGEKLKDLNRDEIPRILRELKEGELRKALSGQGLVNDELSKLLSQVERDLAAALVQDILKNAIEKQRTALDKVKETRLTHEGLEGRAPGELNGEERDALKKAADDQSKATGELEKAKKELRQRIGNLQKSDPDGAEPFRKVLDRIEGDDTERTSRDAGADIGDNKLAGGERKQEKVLNTLRDAEKELNKRTDDEVGRLEKNLADLQDTRDRQRRTNSETENLNPKHDADVNRNAQDQHEVSRRLDGLKADNPELDGAPKKSDEARDGILKDDPSKAKGAQHEVLDALGRAIERTRKDLAEARNRERQGEPADENGPPAGGPPVQASSPSGAEGQEAKDGQPHDAGVGGFRYGKLAADRERNWVVALPQKEREEVEQSLRLSAPPEYRRHIQLYYQSLASACSRAE
ncbi:MAG: hypothetical protein M5U26_05760 [Planctomycetota bacterium]|nr:hypothetical protein [Planctomycetota bacterium]